MRKITETKLMFWVCWHVTGHWRFIPVCVPIMDRVCGLRYAKFWTCLCRHNFKQRGRTWDELPEAPYA
jgi:hypothetical protein